MKRYALDKTAAAMFPKTTGGWCKFADVKTALELARKVIVADRAVLVESYKNRATGRVDDVDAAKWLAQHDEALAAIGRAGRAL